MEMAEAPVFNAVSKLVKIVKPPLLPFIWVVSFLNLSLPLFTLPST